LVVLEGQGIDVILGMNWMKRHRALLDTAARIVHLDSPENGGVTLQLALTPVTTIVVHHTACEFSIVFPEDLPGMPPDWYVEFTIEL
jgi:hypothetical protein